MDEEEIKILKLTRLGREKVIKRGTYDIEKVKQIHPDHPFYAKTEEEPEVECEANSEEVTQPAQEPSEEDLLSQIMSSNFKVGMSQSEVDDFLSGMLK